MSLVNTRNTEKLPSQSDHREILSRLNQASASEVRAVVSEKADEERLGRVRETLRQRYPDEYGRMTDEQMIDLICSATDRQFETRYVECLNGPN